MPLVWPHKLPAMFWAFIVRDSVRIYRVIPAQLKFSYWYVFFLQISTALTETLTLIVLSLFAISVASPEAAMNHFLIRPLLDLFPSIAEHVSTPRRMVGFTSAFMIVFVLFKCALATYTSYATSYFSERVGNYAAEATIDKYVSKPFYWHMSAESGKVIHQILQRSQLSYLTVHLLSLYTNIICSLFLFTSLFIAQPKLTFVIIACFSGASLLLYTSIKKYLDKAGKINASAV
ncbi:MAG: hypothetical protein LBJ61_10970, partial [Deltaproteobacteria bacterium]|nr:hypothetical protein [Deltaproteobacteria bacterium]